MSDCVLIVMNFFSRVKVNSQEFDFLMKKIESFEESTKDMSKNLERVLTSLSEILARQDEKIKISEERHENLEKQIDGLHEKTYTLRLLLASMAGGLAVLTFIAAESGVLKYIFKGDDSSTSSPAALVRQAK